MLGQRMMMAAAGIVPATVSLTANTFDAVDRTVYTFSSQALGTAAANRQIVVVTCSANEGAGARTVSSLTVAGQSASSIITQAGTGGNTPHIALLIATVTSGTTGDVVVTWSGATLRCGIGVYAVYGAASVASDTASAEGSGTPTLALTTTVQAGGVLIGGYMGAGNNVGTVTWANLTEKYDEVIEGNGGLQSGAADAFAALQTDLAVTATPSLTHGDNIGIAAAFDRA